MGFTRKFGLTILVLASFVAVLAVACGSDSEGDAPAAPAAAAPAAPAAPAAAGSAQAPAQPKAAATAIAAPIHSAPVAAAAAGGQRGDFTFAINDAGVMAGYPPLAAYGPQWAAIASGVVETLFAKVDSNYMSPLAAESFEITPDLDSVTVTIKKGLAQQGPIGVNDDFGDLTSHDCVWFFNVSNPSINPESTHRVGGDLAMVFGEGFAVDDYTFTLPAAKDSLITNYNVEELLSEYGKGLGCFSKVAYDKYGPDWMKENIVSTAPFRVREIIPEDRRVLDAKPDHHTTPAHIRSITYLHVPEMGPRIAMWKAGQADIAMIDPVFAGDLEADDGGVFLNPIGKLITSAFMWSGNLWEENHARTGEALEPWQSVEGWVSPYEKDLPWLGNPWCDRGESCMYEDTDNPPGMSDMEQARIVRWALSYALDRPGMVEGLLDGKGVGAPSEYMGPEMSGWDPSKTTTYAKMQAILSKYEMDDCDLFLTQCIKPATELVDHEWPWEIPYDAEFAEKLLDIAGYPRGSNGKRFDMSTNIYLAEIGDVSFDVGDAAAGNWNAIGVNTTILTEDYGAVVSPRFRTREQIWPTLKNGAVDDTTWPPHWPMPPADTSLTRPGWGAGFEDNFLAQMHLRTKVVLDRAVAEEERMDVIEWEGYWKLYTGAVYVPRGYIVWPDKVKDWRGRSTIAHWGTGQPQFIVPADGVK